MSATRINWRRAGMALSVAASLVLGVTWAISAEPTTTTAPAEENAAVVGAAGIIERVTPRAMLTAAEYAALAEELRKLYSEPPEKWPKATLAEGVKAEELGSLPEMIFPKDNPFTKEKAYLGRVLFFDPRLSGSTQISCASCHDPDLSWADGRTTSFGHMRQALHRNAPSLMNAGYEKSFFWDGRAASLEEQAMTPVVQKNEMAGDPKAIVETLMKSEGYRKLFKDAFGEEAISFERVAMAIATFERTIKSGRSPFDRFLAGKKDALSDSAVRGLHVFRTTANCMNCHSGPTMSDNRFHDLGLSYYGRKYEDLGRYEVTKKPEDVGAFKTPGLRNVMRTRPYMHVGFFEIEGVLALYNAGMPTLKRKPGQENDPLFPTKDKLLKPLGLNKQDLEDLIAFLESLNEPILRVRPPELPDFKIENK